MSCSEPSSTPMRAVQVKALQLLQAWWPRHAGSSFSSDTLSNVSLGVTKAPSQLTHTHILALLLPQELPDLEPSGAMTAQMSTAWNRLHTAWSLVSSALQVVQPHLQH